ncbi:hypothetical protein LTR10_020934 [Elasticomyces elasticus]|uniref:BTB domain-containing protein n=1 Tax=Exophiala sideris TaxID=1016849 RepID=A0ABR0JBY4_9EURO|nr:hypothetical protein LTR10_020934 [Elasticomyces elasticus]KAK5031107.1 hypothetical protein LTS07_004842 [Exophiala sideris]KAK5038829.1 hypothetical protein LTR13_003860 [Exophiala sideris]KAK5060712.1 hypothetical protein LTR69_005311 [Exophiala sideris]KAK5183625.1 hypothetical protein LTR44_003907 [Eurotiomycetes sp. CCFEE 6388]
MKETSMEKTATIKKENDGSTPMWAHLKNPDTDYWLASSPIITLVVGKEKQKFYVHKDVLIMDSPFFKKCLSCPMKEASTNVIEFPEDDVLGFERFIIYLYKDEISEAWVGSKEDVLATMYTWLLGDKFMMPDLQNEAMQRIMRSLTWTTGFGMDPAFYAWAIDHLVSTSQLYHATKDTFVWHLSNSSKAYQRGGHHYGGFNQLLDRYKDAGNELLVRSLPLLGLRGPVVRPQFNGYMVGERVEGVPAST